MFSNNHKKGGKMDLKQIQNFIETDYLEWNTYFKNQDKKTEAFAIMLKISEETGELAREVLRSFGYANQKRLDEPSKLDSEFADVIINTILLGRCLDIDMPIALQRKMDMIKEKIKNKGKEECSDSLCKDEAPGC